MEHREPSPHDWREWRRLRAWQLSQEGWGVRAIARALGASPAAVSGWLAVARRRGPEALALLKDNLAKHPDDRDTLLALVAFNRDAGDIAAALDYAAQLQRLAPDDRGIADLVADLRRRREGGRAGRSGGRPSVRRPVDQDDGHIRPAGRIVHRQQVRPGEQRRRARGHFRSVAAVAVSRR